MVEYSQIKNTYRFSCTLCANCCTGDQQVLLTPYDLYKMGRFLHLHNSRQLFDEGWVKLVKGEHDVWRPQILFKNKPFKYCPFLTNELNKDGKLIGRCQLHPANKPLVCAMAPVGRIVDTNKNTDEFVFIKPAPDCPGINSRRENRLEDLLETHRKELDYQWQFFELLDKVRGLKMNANDSLIMLYTFPLSKEFEEIVNNRK